MSSNDGDVVSALVSEMVDTVTKDATNLRVVTNPIGYISSHRSPNAIGMTNHWIPETTGIGGEFKMRYTDFIVHEVTMEGRIIQLSRSTKPPVATWLVKSEQDFNDSNENLELRSELKEALGEKLFIELGELASKDVKTEEFIEFEASDDKELRKKQHHAIKVLWSGLVAETVNSPDGQRLIRVARQAKQLKSGDRRRPNEQRWPGDQRYCHFVLYKEQLDTTAALAYLSKCLHVPMKAFHFAGMKDKRGSTSQRISSDRVSAEKIIRAVQSYKNNISCILVSDFSYEPDPIKLGDLAGNHFSVVLRDIRVSPQLVNVACESVRSLGFANYFGPQRFGTAASFSTADIGLLLLQCRWSEAVDAIIKAALEAKCDRSGNDPRVAETLAAWFDNRDAEQASRSFPGPFRAGERQMLMALAKNPADYIGAIRKMPRSLILMYGHAYQSLVWNKITAKRIATFGNTKVLPGDLVYSETSQGHFVMSNDVEDCCDDELFDSDISEFNSNDVRAIAEAEVAQVKIESILLPLPGLGVIMPKNVIADWYQEILKVDGVKFNECGQQMPELMLSGTYRQMMVKPSNFTWKMVSYQNPTDQINTTDRDKISDENRACNNNLCDNHNDHSAVILDFQLPACSYASVLVWELSKSQKA